MAIPRAFVPTLLLVLALISCTGPVRGQSSFASESREQDQTPLRILDLSSDITAMIPPSMHTQDYGLPTDDPEHKRLDIQHTIWKLMLSNGRNDTSGLYPQEVEDMIEDHLAQISAPSIMDLGSGSGAWAIDMAQRFNNTEVVGLDQALPTSEYPNLPNLSFVKKDIMDGLDEYESHFDFVHSRCVAGHMNDRPAFMKIILKILKPGGLLVLSDGNLGIFDPSNAKRVSDETSIVTKHTLPGVAKSQPDLEVGKGLWLDWWCEKAVGTLLRRTQDPEHAGGDKLLWHVERLSSFTLIREGVKEYFSPVKSAEKKGKLTREGKNVTLDLETLSSKNMLNFLNSSRPILTGAGYASEDIDHWQKMAREDIENAEYGWALKWNVVTARKKQA